MLIFILKFLFSEPKLWKIWLSEVPESQLTCSKIKMKWSFYAAAAAAKSLQSCLILCDPIDSSPPGSPVPGIFQASKMERVAISFSNVWKWKVKVKSLVRVLLFATPWTAAHQAPPTTGFARQEYWSGVPLPSPILSTAKLILRNFFCVLFFFFFFPLLESKSQNCMDHLIYQKE